MFSYYGSKSKIVHLYPPPKFNKIIEPFAGSARYSLRFWQKDVLLVDKYKKIIDVWDYLINASIKDISRLPKLNIGDNINNFNLSNGEKCLLSMLVNIANTGRNSMTKRAFNMYDLQIKNIKREIYKIKHWKIKHADYNEIENEIATYFIDPPYQFGGHEYKHNNKNINFKQLGDWCKNRNGQIIVCENTKANWLPFKPIIKMQGQIHKTTEAIWSNLETNYEYQQLKLF